MMPVRTYAVRLAISIVFLSVAKGHCQMVAGGGAFAAGAGFGGAGVGGLSSTINGSVGGAGVHQGHILTGPGATGIPSNYFRGAAPGMSLSPQQSPSGAFNGGLYSSLPLTRSGSTLGLPRRGTGAGVAMGRGVGPAPQGGDKNPARILLERINGRRDGKGVSLAPLRPPNQYPRGSSDRSPSISPSRSQQRAVYFAERGDYEDMVYRPNRGSYRQQPRSESAAGKP